MSESLVIGQYSKLPSKKIRLQSISADTSPHHSFIDAEQWRRPCLKRWLSYAIIPNSVFDSLFLDGWAKNAPPHASLASACTTNPRSKQGKFHTGAAVKSLFTRENAEFFACIQNFTGTRAWSIIFLWKFHEWCGCFCKIQYEMPYEICYS